MKSWFVFVLEYSDFTLLVLNKSKPTSVAGFAKVMFK